ncbi:hypothetical protein TNCV_820381 [Trichonephila clavipes]|nr:hypothetical protein TNCV_820381 [Trichonephila clavipes]
MDVKDRLDRFPSRYQSIENGDITSDSKWHPHQSMYCGRAAWILRRVPVSILSCRPKESYQLKTFVANRIEQWHYVSTEDNPADFVSRGMDSLKRKTRELWWNGPKFLMSKAEQCKKKSLK